MSDSSTGAQARRYAAIRRRLMLLEMAASLAFLLAYQLSGLSVEIARRVEATLPSPWLQAAAYLAVFGAVSYVAFAPLHFYSGFVLEHRFGLSRMRLRDWVIRELKQIVLSGLLGLLLMEGLYALLRQAPGSWVWMATIGWVGVTVILARVFPTLLLPIFYKTVPVQDESLVQRLLALCRRAELSVLGVFRVDLGVETRKANAALAGLGRTRRVMVSDTLLERFTPDEIETVLAHELGHQHSRHITKLLALSAVGSWLAFWLIDRASAWWIPALQLRGLSDLAGFPMLMLSLSVIGLLGLPIQNGISRHFEWQADRFAVALTKSPKPFASALRKLGELNLADPSPPAWVEWLFYDHPPIGKRIIAAESAAS